MDSGFWWQLPLAFPIEISSSHVNTMRKSSPVPTICCGSWVDAALNSFPLIFPSPQIAHLNIAIASGKFGQYMKPSRNTSPKPLSHLGSPALMSQLTFPGWVYCPRKPHPQGNEYHTICCGQTGILFDFEVVEGRDRHAQLGKPEYEVEHGKTSGLLLRLTKSIHQSARYVVLDSGYCVLKVLISFRKSGVFACSLIKECRYWPAYWQGEAIDHYFVGKNIDDTASVEG